MLFCHISSYLQVAAIICLTASAAVIHEVNTNDYLQFILDIDPSFISTNSQLYILQDLINDSTDVSKFAIFLAIFVFIVEIPTIVGRILLQAGVRMSQILHAVVSPKINLQGEGTLYYSQAAQ